MVKMSSSSDPVARELADTGRGWSSRGYLPHYDSSHVIQFITWRLADSLPRPVILKLEQKLELLGLEATRLEAKRRKQFESVLDRGYGECWLHRKRCAEIVRDCLLAQHEKLYLLHAFVLMPNHVHLLVQFAPGNAMSDVVSAWKDSSAHEINRAVGRTGNLWQEDFWDRYIRDLDHYENALRYVRLNPVKAGLVKRVDKWPWIWGAPNRR